MLPARKAFLSLLTMDTLANVSNWIVEAYQRPARDGVHVDRRSEIRREWQLADLRRDARQV